MPPVAFSEAHRLAVQGIVSAWPGVRAGKMFGYPAWYVGKKLFACVYSDGVGVKVPQELAMALRQSAHIRDFQPMGKPKMREWVQINRSDPAELALDKATLHSAYAYVLSLSG